MKSKKRYPWPIIGILTILGIAIIMFFNSLFFVSLLSSIYFHLLLGVLALVGPGTFLVYSTSYPWKVAEQLVIIALYSMLITTSFFFVGEKIIVPLTPVLLAGIVIITNVVMAIVWFTTKIIYHHK